MSKEAINELKPTIQKLSVAQRKQLEINETDIYFAFPYQVGIIFDEEQEKIQKRWVEITMVFHVLRGLTEMRNRGEEIPWNMGQVLKNDYSTIQFFTYLIDFCKYRLDMYVMSVNKKRIIITNLRIGSNIVVEIIKPRFTI